MIEAARPPVARPLFVVTILVGSFLLFMVQPMVARMALPRLGGAPNVWNSAMLVYQALLLAGYAYAHWIGQLPFRRQAKLHLFLLLLFALTLPIALFGLEPSASGWEVLWVPLLLVLTVGPVFFIVAAQAPLMQRWFAAHPGSGEPWALYAASNLGSFAGLIAYPLLAEPLLSLESQGFVWSAGYGLLVVLVALAAWSRWSVGGQAAAAGHAEGFSVPPETISPVEDGQDRSREQIGAKRIALWLALSAVPSGLMLSTTTHLTTDIFAMPMLWVIPLGLYLLSFVVAFADNRDFTWAITVLAPITMLLAGGFAMVSRHSGSFTIAFASILLLFVIAVSLHGRLYDLRPHVSRLTLFYLVMSAGGALGGAFTAVLAPVLFDWVWEHPILVLAAALLMPLPKIFQWRRMAGLDPGVARLAAAVLLALAAFLAWMLLSVAGEPEPGIHRTWLTIMLVGIGLLLIPWRSFFVAVLIMTMLAQGGATTLKTTIEGVRTRSYFGIYTVRDHPESQLRMLVHGTTLHGQQATDPERRREPTTYYGPASGVGLALDAAPEFFGQNARIGVVGLGTGTLACWRRPGQTWTFFEIDPLMLEFSRNGTFTFVRDCAPKARMVLGDARVELEKTPQAAFDVLVVDAFSSDAIPVHLLTEEAIEVYMRTLSQDGLLVLHISNRFIKLEPVLSAIAERLGLTARLRHDVPEDTRLHTASSWVVLARDEARLEALAQARPDTAWEELGPPAQRVWTDDYASILPHIRWQQLLGSL